MVIIKLQLQIIIMELLLISLDLDWYDVEYPRQLILQNDSLVINYNENVAEGFKTFQVSNVTSP